MKTFCTLIPVREPINLLKDVGMIPYAMGKYYRTKFVSFIREEDATSFLRQVPGLETESLGPDDCATHTLEMRNPQMMAYIKAHAREIDVLHLFFLKNSMFYGMLYKRLNPSGTLYLKMDGNVLKMKKEARSIKEIVRWPVYKWYLNHIVDKVTIESSEGRDFMSRRYGLDDSRLMYMPNGMDDKLIGDPIPWNEKENIILNVARLGSYPKRTEMILEAARKVQWHSGWRMKLVGPVEPGFKKEFIPGVEWAGPTFDRKALFDIYRKSKVFCLTSEFESFGLVCVEAQAFGNYLLLTPFSSAPDFIAGGTAGEIVEDADALAKAMQDIIDGKKDISAKQDAILEHSKQYYWTTLANRLFEFLEK